MIKTGLDNLVNSDFSELKGAKVGLLAHAASVDSQINHAANLLHNSSNCELVRLFAPEHGIMGSFQDMEVVKSSEDSVTSLPIVSLYGNSPKSLFPPPEMLEDLDVVIVDLQDVGSRYYTYTQTLAYMMIVAGKVGVKVLILDRPNPIGGLQIEGAPLNVACRSFCGLYPVANRHGLTIGELGKLMQAGFGEGEIAQGCIDCELEVISMSGWKRSMYFEQTGLPWVLPSPNMPSVETAVTYPGTCLLEGTNLSEGRGTTRPLDSFGAPYLNAKDFIAKVYEEDLELEGAAFRPITFTPAFQKWADKYCFGAQIHVLDRKKFKPFRWGLAITAAARRHFPLEFSWRESDYEFIKDHPAIDLLFGSHEFRKCVETEQKLSTLLPAIEAFESWYEEARKEFYLYEEVE